MKVIKIPKNVHIISSLAKSKHEKKKEKPF